MAKMSNMSKKIYYTTGEIAEICHASRATVFNWIKAGKLKASRIPGGKYKIFRRDFLDFLRKSNLLALLEESNSLHQTTKILIIDDQPDIVEAIKIFLEKSNPHFHVRGVTNGFGAGHLIHSFKPDIVILDLFMPGLDGFAVCRDVKSNLVTKNIKIIAITGYPTEENIEKIKKEGADAVFAKPLDYNNLLKRIERLVKLKK